MGNSVVEISILHHLGFVFMLLWILDLFNLCHPGAYVVSLVYLYMVIHNLSCWSIFFRVWLIVWRLMNWQMFTSCDFSEVNERLMMKFRRNVQCDEAKETNQRRVFFTSYCFFLGCKWIYLGWNLRSDDLWSCDFSGIVGCWVSAVAELCSWKAMAVVYGADYFTEIFTSCCTVVLGEVQAMAGCKHSIYPYLFFAQCCSLCTSVL